MSPLPEPLIDSRQTDALAKWFEGLRGVIQERAEDLLEDEAISRLWWTQPGREFRALVRGTRVYQLVVRLPEAKGRPEIECSCPYGAGCKHAGAVVLAVLDGAEIALDPGLPRVVAPKPAPSAAPPEAAPAAPSAAEEGLRAAVRPFIGKPLGPTDRATCERLERLFAERRRTITTVGLAQLVAHPHYTYLPSGYVPPGSPQIELWPEHRPPANVLETWFYVARALRQERLLPSSNLFAKVPWERVEEFIAPWLREQEAERWKARLHQLAERSVARAQSPAFRLRLGPDAAVVECRLPGQTEFGAPKLTWLNQQLRAVASALPQFSPAVDLDERALRFLELLRALPQPTSVPLSSPILPLLLGRLLRDPSQVGAVAGHRGAPLERAAETLRWRAQERSGESGERDYEFHLALPDGSEPPPLLFLLPGVPALYVAAERFFALEEAGFVDETNRSARLLVPAAAVESTAGLAALDRLQVPPPPHLAERIVTVPVRVRVWARMARPNESESEYLQIRAVTETGGHAPAETWDGETWWTPPKTHSAQPKRPDAASVARLDRTAARAALPWLAQLGVRTQFRPSLEEIWVARRLSGVAALRQFPEEFLNWLEARPDAVEVELCPELAALRGGQVSGFVGLEAESAGVDWFDLQVVVRVTDVELTPAEVAALLAALGRWVRLPGKGWRRLDLRLDEEEQRQLADLGLGVADLAGGEPQRLHVLQLAGAAAGRLLPESQLAEVRRRAADLQTSVQPAVPAAIRAELRPYQLAGYHFLAYLSANRFGGILADDMGLGKTLQALTWLAWLRESGGADSQVLVVCPKSVQENWRTEAARFYPDLSVRVWTRDEVGEFGPPDAGELVIVNYAQLRLYAAELRAQKWSVVILDEAQFIKNPASATAKAAIALRADHRLALSGTPIENRLLDLWSILTFAMPGVLGTQSGFARNFNAKDDPLARRRLAARVRPFLLRRTKREVASDLPVRTEEDLSCTLEGAQATLYRAELKRARSLLLGAKTARQLDSLRFHVLSSLLRLRQICCHPWLVGSGRPEDGSAKLDALLELLEPLVEECHKVLVFSQFVEMLELIRARLAERGWAHLVLTGQTEDRGELVADFQSRSDPCVFLISLKAGGFGLNLTAASYVVLFDPWWNPAVENQAIDRTHRIGQTNPVIAYRLLVQGTIEEKIRQLQRQKSALASDILGEETFAKALTLEDFRFLLE